MNTKNLPILYIALGLISFSLWTSWKQDAQPQAVKVESSPVLRPISNPSPEIPSSSSANLANLEIKTDVYDLKLNAQGNIVFASLQKYPNTTGPDASPLVLLKKNPQEQYYANSEFVRMVDNKATAESINYQSSQPLFVMEPGQDQLKIVLEGTTAEGIKVQKIYQFQRDSYVIDLSYQLFNPSDKAWTAYLNQQLIWQNPQTPEHNFLQIGGYRSFIGGSYSQPGKQRYKKLSFEDMTKQNLDVDAHGGWVAMQQHYFLSAWVPNANGLYRLYTKANQNKYVIGAVSEPYTLAPQQNLNLNTRLYLGPEEAKVLKSIAPGLDQTIDYGILWFLSDLLFSLMKTIEHFIGNWGWSIVIVTVLIKLLFYRLSAQSYKSMAKMRNLQPKLEQLKQRFGHDRAKFSQATMELYRQEKVNPLGGCLPMLVQVPVFIALYSVLVESVDLRQAPFILWIHDLSAADPFHVLPLVMGLTLFIQQKLNPTPPDPAHAKAMMLLPIFMTFIFWGFPAGLVLYWIVNNSLSILQQWWIMRKFANLPLVTSA